MYYKLLGYIKKVVTGKKKQKLMQCHSYEKESTELNFCNLCTDSKSGEMNPFCNRATPPNSSKVFTAVNPSILVEKVAKSD